MNKEKEKVE